LWYLDKAGVKVPSDVEIISYGDKSIADLSLIPFSYIRIPTRELADFASDKVLSWIFNKEKPLNFKEKFCEELILQSTTINNS
jgi:DNA-binding LacI/PurR family transcriptional regulator